MTCGGQLPNGIERPLLRSVEFLSSGSLLSCTEGDQLKFVCNAQAKLFDVVNKRCF